MVIIKTEGGLGNQMFQYAFGKQIAIKNKTNLYLDTTWYRIQFYNQTPRNFELNKFRIGQIKNITKEKKDLIIFFVYILLKFKIFKSLCQNEVQFHYKPKIKFNFFVNYYSGYWQSYKYFYPIKDLLANEFIPNELSEKARGLINRIAVSQAISIHVRRGDYVNNASANSFHGLCDLDYYYKSINYIRCNKQVDLICIFSDDIDWVKQNLFIEGVEIIYVSEFVIDHIQEFEIMKQCQHNIIANSSFSWWAAFLNSNPEKIVIAPKKWFNDESINTSDLCPQEWIRL